MNGRTITILCSGVAMGVYIPAILLDYQLRRNGVKAEVYVLENLMSDEKKGKILENKKAFHQSFRVALTGQKMNRDLGPSFDPAIVDETFNCWQREQRRDFIVFSGFWMSILQKYVQRSGYELNIDILHMDADISASWKNHREDFQESNHIWLFDWKEQRLIYELRVTGRDPIPYHERHHRYVIHGGGWGMGTYQSKIPEMASMGVALDIVAYNPAEAGIPYPNSRYFMVDPDWSPWFKNSENRHEFPPFGELRTGDPTIFRNKPEHHELFDVIAQSKGIISKPGGATLVDSLSSATPIIMLDPFGDYERKNAELWETLGFGISYEKWRDSGYSEAILETLHRNLLNAKSKQIDCVSNLVKRYKSETLQDRDAPMETVL